MSHSLLHRRGRYPKADSVGLIDQGSWRPQDLTVPSVQPAGQGNEAAALSQDTQSSPCFKTAYTSTHVDGTLTQAKAAADNSLRSDLQYVSYQNQLQQQSSDIVNSNYGNNFGTALDGGQFQHQQFYKECPSNGSGWDNQSDTWEWGSGAPSSSGGVTTNNNFCGNNQHMPAQTIEETTHRVATDNAETGITQQSASPASYLTAQAPLNAQPLSTDQRQLQHSFQSNQYAHLGEDQQGRPHSTHSQGAWSDWADQGHWDSWSGETTSDKLNDPQTTHAPSNNDYSLREIQLQVSKSLDASESSSQCNYTVLASRQENNQGDAYESYRQQHPLISKESLQPEETQKGSLSQFDGVSNRPTPVGEGGRGGSENSALSRPGGVIYKNEASTSVSSANPIKKTQPHAQLSEYSDNNDSSVCVNQTMLPTNDGSLEVDLNDNGLANNFPDGIQMLDAEACVERYTKKEDSSKSWSNDAHVSNSMSPSDSNNSDSFGPAALPPLSELFQAKNERACFEESNSAADHTNPTEPHSSSALASSDGLRLMLPSHMSNSPSTDCPSEDFTHTQLVQRDVPGSEQPESFARSQGEVVRLSYFAGIEYAHRRPSVSHNSLLESSAARPELGLLQFQTDSRGVRQQTPGTDTDCGAPSPRWESNSSTLESREPSLARDVVKHHTLVERSAPAGSYNTSEIRQSPLGGENKDRGDRRGLLASTDAVSNHTGPGDVSFNRNDYTNSVAAVNPSNIPCSGSAADTVALSVELPQSSVVLSQKPTHERQQRCLNVDSEPLSSGLDDKDIDTTSGLHRTEPSGSSDRLAAVISAGHLQKTDKPSSKALEFGDNVSRSRCSPVLVRSGSSSSSSSTSAGSEGVEHDRATTAQKVRVREHELPKREKRSSHTSSHRKPRESSSRTGNMRHDERDDRHYDFAYHSDESEIRRHRRQRAGEHERHSRDGENDRYRKKYGSDRGNNFHDDEVVARGDRGSRRSDYSRRRRDSEETENSEYSSVSGKYPFSIISKNISDSIGSRFRSENDDASSGSRYTKRRRGGNDFRKRGTRKGYTDDDTDVDYRRRTERHRDHRHVYQIWDRQDRGVTNAYDSRPHSRESFITESSRMVSDSELSIVERRHPSQHHSLPHSRRSDLRYERHPALGGTQREGSSNQSAGLSGFKLPTRHTVSAVNRGLNRNSNLPATTFSADHHRQSSQLVNGLQATAMSSSTVLNALTNGQNLQLVKQAYETDPDYRYVLDEYFERCAEQGYDMREVQAFICGDAKGQPSLNNNFSTTGLALAESTRADASLFFASENSELATAEELKKFNRPHAIARFTSMNTLVKINRFNLTVDRKPPQLEMHDLKLILEDEQESKELAKFPGPLVRAETHKNQVIHFCNQRINAARRNKTVVSPNEHFIVDRESYILLWELLVLLLRQNGHVTGTDIAELLLKDAPYVDPASVQRLAEEDMSQVEEISDDAANSDDSQTTLDSARVNRMASDRQQRHRRNIISPEQSLAKFRELLLFGHRREAIEHAIRCELWGHAFCLASKLSDLKLHAHVHNRFYQSMMSNDPLHTVYQLYSGRQPISVVSVGDVSWGDWRPHLAMILSNPSVKPENDARSIVTMGDALLSRGCLYAAHFCYLMAQVDFGDFTDRSSKLVLLGSNHSHYYIKHDQPVQTVKAACIDSFASNEAIMCTEIYEYAQSLSNPGYALPTLGIYKFLHAKRLVCLGFVQEALAYCERLANDFIRNPSGYKPTLVFEVYALASRLKFNDVHYTQGSGDYDELGDPEWLLRLEQLCCAIRTGDVFEMTPRSTPAHSHKSDIAQPLLTGIPTEVGSGSFSQPLANNIGSISQAPTVPDGAAVDRNVYHYGRSDVTQQSFLPAQFSTQSTEAPSFVTQAHEPTAPAAICTDIKQEFQAEGVSSQLSQLKLENDQDRFQENRAVQDNMLALTSQEIPTSVAHISGYDQAHHVPTTTGSIPSIYQQQSASHQSRAPVSFRSNFAQQPRVGFTERNRIDSISSSITSSASIATSASPTLTDVTKYNEGSHTQPKDPRVLTDPQTSAEATRSASQGDTRRAAPTSHAGRSWLGGIFGKLLPKGPNQMILPEDKDASIVWDAERKSWIDRHADPPTADASCVAPPSDLALGLGSAIGNSSGSWPSNNVDQYQQHQTQQPTGSASSASQHNQQSLDDLNTLPQPLPGTADSQGIGSPSANGNVNRFQRKSNKPQYVDVLKQNSQTVAVSSNQMPANVSSASLVEHHSSGANGDMPAFFVPSPPSGAQEPFDLMSHRAECDEFITATANAPDGQ